MDLPSYGSTIFESVQNALGKIGKMRQRHMMIFYVHQSNAMLAFPEGMSILDAVTSSGILKAKQKLGVTFNSDKLGGIDFTKFSKLSMCSAGAGRC